MTVYVLMVRTVRHNRCPRAGESAHVKSQWRVELVDTDQRAVLSLQSSLKLIGNRDRTFETHVIEREVGRVYHDVSAAQMA